MVTRCVASAVAVARNYSAVGYNAGRAGQLPRMPEHFY
jgi:hypothetical protein